MSQGKTFQVTTALERTVQTYDVRKLNLLFVSSPPTPGVIARVVAHKDVVYVAFADPNAGGGVWIFKRGKKSGELQQPSQRWGAWKELIVFGEWVVGAFGEALVVWRRESGEVYTEIKMGGRCGVVTAVCHPSAYLNKLVVARRNGDLEIWNIKTRYFMPDLRLNNGVADSGPARKSTPSSPWFRALQLPRRQSRFSYRVR